MADEKNAPPEKTPEEDKQTEESEPKAKLLGKFKSEKELAKAYKELESKLGEQSEEVRRSKEFAQVVQPVLDAIRDDPELFKKLDEKLRQKDQSSDSPDAPAKSNKATGQDEVRDAASELIRAKFEERHGINKLPSDKQKAMRQRIGDIIYELTGETYANVDLRRLGPVLENAYILANKDELIEKSKLEALAEAGETEKATMPGIPSSPGKGDGALSSEETEIASKLGLTKKQYLQGKKV